LVLSNRFAVKTKNQKPKTKEQRPKSKDQLPQKKTWPKPGLCR